MVHCLILIGSISSFGFGTKGTAAAALQIALREQGTLVVSTFSLQKHRFFSLSSEASKKICTLLLTTLSSWLHFLYVLFTQVHSSSLAQTVFGSNKNMPCY